MKVHLGSLLGVVVLTGLGWLGSAQAAVPVANTELKIDITVTVQAVVRIEWGAATTLGAAGGVTNATWNVGTLAYDAQKLSSADGVLTVRNAGFARVDVTAIVSTVDAATVPPGGQAWTVSDAGPGKDIYAIKLTPTAGVKPPDGGVTAQDLNSALAKPIITDFRKNPTNDDVTIVLTYKTPNDTDEEFIVGANIQHSHQVLLSAAAG